VIIHNMNFLLSIITFLPTLKTYLKGVSLFHERQYEAAIKAFEKCIIHPKFTNELLFSYYGQSLCGVGKLEEACPYLVKASQIYESEGWLFKDDQTFNLAKNTIAALKYIADSSDIEINRSVFNAELRIIEN